MPVDGESKLDYLWDKFKAWRRGDKRWTARGVTRGRIYIKRGADAESTTDGGDKARARNPRNSRRR